MRWSLALSALFLALPGAALAQFAAPPPQAPSGARPPPPALPGLAARQAPEPIPANPNANLTPTAALFDAINRGDPGAARDAVARGASLDERNVLGLTAIEAAVDQGRNDILFYLLSARASIRSPQPAEANLTPAQRAARDRAAEQEAARAARAAAQAAQAGPGRVVRAQSLRPRLFANDGGSPRPDVGFLGFDAGRNAAAGRTRGG